MKSSKMSCIELKEDELASQLASLEIDTDTENVNLDNAEIEGSPTPRNKNKIKGKRGKRIRLITNYIRVFVDKKQGIYQYKATFHPPIDNLEIRKQFLTQFDNVVGEQKVFDGLSLFLPSRLEKDHTVLRGFHPKHSEVKMRVALEYLKRKPYKESVQFFNVLFRRVMTVLGKFELGRSFFDKDIKFNLPQYKLQIWPGICTSAEEQEEGLMLCMDTSFRVFRTDTVYDYICALNDLQEWKQTFSDYILGKVVVTRYNNFTYKIDDIDWEKTPQTIFQCNGKEMTYTQYYKSQYNIDVQDQNQPMLLTRIKVKKGYRETEQVKIISIIPELCYVCGINQKYLYDTKSMKEVQRYTFCSPEQKLRALRSFVSRLNENDDALRIFESWNLRVDSSILEVEARELSGPLIQFNDKTKAQEAKPAFQINPSDGFYDAVPLNRWLIICQKRDEKLAKQFRCEYLQTCKEASVSCPHSGDIFLLSGQDPQDYREALEYYATSEKRFQFVIIMMVYPMRDIYSVIKTFCCSERSIPSQVVLTRSLRQGQFAITVKNLVMQMNCKLGGALWGMVIPGLSEKIMFVGIDVNHDVKKKLPSVVGLIASLNRSCTKYFSKAHVQKIHQEITDNMQSLFSEALECYFEVNGSYPDRIIVFRDGGSLSSMPILIEHEVKPIVASIKLLCPQMKNFTYSIVSKRVPQRFFRKDEFGMTRNPIPGTVIDTSVTYPNMLDFYVVSQNRSHGAVSPTHYMVIYDIGGIKADLLQQLAYSTTYMYYNWSGSIQVPAMIQYAHKLSSLVGQNIRGMPTIHMDKLLYYL